MDEIRRIIRNLKHLQDELKSSEIPLKSDEDGFIDKECPNQECLFEFKVHAEDWEKKFKDEEIYCPNCRNCSPANTYYTTEFVEQIQGQIIEHVRNRIFKDLPFPNRLLPHEAKEKWSLKIECESCLSKYSVIGNAFFCPCCGTNSIERTFKDSINKIKLKVSEIESIRDSLAVNLGIDEANILARSLKESCLSDCVVSFQHYSNLLFEKIASKKPKFNVFQKIEDGSNEWKKEIGEGYDDWVTINQKELMNKLFQQRHLFSHSDGHVDQKYIDKSKDLQYQVGQRIVVNKSEVFELVEVILKITEEIKKHVV